MKHLVLFAAITLLASCGNDDQKKAGKDSTVCILPAPVFAPSSMRDSIGKLENLHSRLIKNGNGDSLLIQYSANASIMDNAETFYSGTEGVKNYWTDQHAIYDEHIRTMISLSGNESLLYETGIEAAKGRFEKDHRPFTSNRKYLVIWEKKDGQWKIAVEMWNELPKDETDGD